MLYTVGHSTLSDSDFVKMLDGRVDTIIDVRSHPNSRWPQFCKENMEQWLPASGIGYEQWPCLGGWDKRHVPMADKFAEFGVDLPVYGRGKFPKQRIAVNTLPKSENDAKQEFLPCCKPVWTNTGLLDYSFFMTLPEFLEGADSLIARSKSENVGFLCSEVLWWKCHRSLIADYLVFLEEDPWHLQPKLTRHANAIGNRLERYEPEVAQAWNLWRNDGKFVDWMPQEVRNS